MAPSIFRAILPPGRGARGPGPAVPRRDGRVAEGARLESVYTGNRIVGSNPTPSASVFEHDILRRLWTCTKYPLITPPLLKYFSSLRFIFRSFYRHQRRVLAISR